MCRRLCLARADRIEEDDQSLATPITKDGLEECGEKMKVLLSESRGKLPQWPPDVCIFEWIRWYILSHLRAGRRMDARLIGKTPDHAPSSSTVV